MPVPFLHHREDPADRISPLDMSNLRIEEHGMSMHIAALALLTGEPLRDDMGELRIQDIRRYVEERSRHAGRLRQVLVWPTGHRTPAWGDDLDFDIVHHVRTRAVPPPGDEEALLRVCCELTVPRLDRRRPLWELWLLDGLADDRVALLLRLHHVVADGAAALDLFSSMLEPAPATPALAPASTRGADPPPPRTVAGSPEPQPHPKPGWIGRVKAIGAGGAVAADQGWALARLGRAPALSWNQPVGSNRLHLLVRGDLARAKGAAHQHGGKVNDVVLAAVAGGAYRLLQSRGELTRDLDMHVSVAASIRRPGETGGNRVGVRVVPVPVSDPDAASRLDSIVTRTAEQRHRRPLQPSGRLLQRWMVHIMKRQRLINLVLSNMPGPPAPLWFAGAQVQEFFQLSLLQGNCAIGVGVLSYAGQLNFDVVADPDIVPDAAVFAEGIGVTLDVLGATRENTARAMR